MGRVGMGYRGGSILVHVGRVIHAKIIREKVVWVRWGGKGDVRWRRDVVRMDEM